MAVKTFTVSETLTASDTNTYLANSGLVYVTSTTFSGSSSVSINNCFTSTYTNYRVILSLNGSSAGAYAQLRMRASGTDQTGADWYRYGYYTSYGTGLTTYNAGGSTSFQPVGQWSSVLQSSAVMDIFEPQTANRTNLLCNTNDTGLGAVYNLNAVLALTTAYDGFTIFSSAGTMTGTITVMGYRKA